MFCSTIIPTVGRESLARAVNSVLFQSFDRDDFEIIVVNDSGQPLIPQDWQTSHRVKVVNTNHHERSIARNTGAAIARGKYLHFLDDDDWLFPSALDCFWELTQHKQTAWYYGSTQLVDRNGQELIRLDHGIQGNCFLHAMAGEWIPLQSSLIDLELFHLLGGFSPLVTGPEDIDLLRRICLHGEVVGTPNLIAHIEMGSAGSTTDYNRHPEMSRQAREKILDDPNAFLRMKEGATSGFWFGKLLRIYITSAVWNLRHKQISAAGSRLVSGLRVVGYAGFKNFSKEFWDSLIKSYQSPTFERGIELSGRDFGGK
jgi:glycosyltransferase involved in cell wall biosynthesis